ncbi:MAG: Smr/MutS family protein [Steroidobacteraceae bacterium]
MTAEADSLKNPADNDEAQIFRDAMRGVKPLRSTARSQSSQRRPKPRARFARAEKLAVLEESLSLSAEQLDTYAADELSFRRDGVQDSVLRRLRRGQYRRDAEIDLHGLTGAQARLQLRQFLTHAALANWRCVRIVHGKGLRSGHRGPVLKTMLNSTLRRLDSVLAFTSARHVDGGSGALYVLLRRPGGMG